MIKGRKLALVLPVETQDLVDQGHRQRGELVPEHLGRIALLIKREQVEQADLTSAYSPAKPPRGGDWRWPGSQAGRGRPEFPPGGGLVLPPRRLIKLNEAFERFVAPDFDRLGIGLDDLEPFEEERLPLGKLLPGRQGGAQHALHGAESPGIADPAGPGPDLNDADRELLGLGRLAVGEEQLCLGRP